MRIHTASLSQHRSHALVLAALHLTLLAGLADPLGAVSPPGISSPPEAPAEGLPVDPPSVEPAVALLEASFTLPSDHPRIVSTQIAHLARETALESVTEEIAPPDAYHARSRTTLYGASDGHLALASPSSHDHHAPAGTPYRTRHFSEILNFDGTAHAGPDERQPGR